MNEPTKEQIRVCHAISSLPYGAGLIPRYDPEGITLNIVANFLEALGERLRDVAIKHTEDKTKLDQLQNDVGAIRRLFNKEVVL